jgi:hypothetical protein
MTRPYPDSLFEEFKKIGARTKDECLFLTDLAHQMGQAPRHLRDEGYTILRDTKGQCVGWKPPQNKKTILDFCGEVFKNYNKSETRKGQHIMNEFTKMFPEIEVPDDADCYYDDNKIDSFYEFLRKLKLE